MKNMKRQLVILFVLSLCFVGCNSKKSSGQEEVINPTTSNEPHVHTFVDYPSKPATCEEDGHIAYAECTGCGKYFNVLHTKQISEQSIKLAKLSHVFVDYQALEPTCSQVGYIAHSECSRCGKAFTLDHQQELSDYLIAKTPHQFINHPAVDSSCEHAGNIAYASCSVCGAIYDASHEHEITDDSYIIPQEPHTLIHHDAVPYSTIEYWECSECLQKFSDANGTQVVTDVSDTISTHDILNENVKNYLSATTEAAQIEALQHPSPFNNQVKKSITWGDNGNGPFRIELSLDDTFAEYKTYSSNTSSFTFPGTLIPGKTYYYRVFDNSGTRLRLSGFDVDGTYPVRTLAVDGVSNVRDAGGWTAKGGNKVLYDKIFRGGRLTNISADGKETLLGDLGVKTEIDLRAGNGGSQELVDARLSYNQIGMTQYTMLVPNYTSPYIEGKDNTRYGFDSTTPTALKNIFEKLANPNSYPIYYHCNAGADRTGSLTYFINGLLGVSYEDLVKDFELTTFSAQGNRFRSGVEDGHFVTTGEMAGIYQCNSDNYVAFGKLHELISTNYAQSNGQLCSAIEYYLKKVCDISNETIVAVRRNLLGKDVEFDPVNLTIDTTFTPSNGNWTINNQLTCETGTFHGSECYKFTTNANNADHYIENNLALIENSAYNTFHFEIYVPDTSAKWNVTSGCRFAMSIKPNGGSTNRIEYSEDNASTTGNYRHVNVNAWTDLELDITGLSNLVRFAFYLPYGSSERPVEIYLRNVYVYQKDLEPPTVDTTFTPTNGNWTINSQLTCEAGTFHGSDCYKFTTNANSDDHYIHHNLSLIENDNYTTFHFEIYIPDSSAKWSIDSGCRFAMSIKPNGGSTNRIEYSEDYSSTTGNYRHVEIDTWTTLELDITGLTNLNRFAFYLPYGSSERPVEIYLRNVYVE